MGSTASPSLSDSVLASVMHDAVVTKMMIMIKPLETVD